MDWCFTVSMRPQVRCIVEFEPKTASVFDGLIACEAPEGWKRFWGQFSAGSLFDTENQRLVQPSKNPPKKLNFGKSTLKHPPTPWLWGLQNVKIFNDVILWYCWWLKSCNQLRLVVYPMIYKVLAPSQVVVWDFSHQQYWSSWSWYFGRLPDSQALFFAFFGKKTENPETFDENPLKRDRFKRIFRLPTINFHKTYVLLTSSHKS